jgi:hypothetical protein
MGKIAAVRLPCAGPTGAPVLIFSRRKSIVLFALIALFLAQSAAQFHALTHLGDRSVPGSHAPLCTDCVSHAPLLTMAGGAAVVLLLAFQAYAALRSSEYRSQCGRTFRHAFRPRAPPR